MTSNKSNDSGSHVADFLVKLRTSSAKNRRRRARYCSQVVAADPPVEKVLYTCRVRLVEAAIH